MTLSLQLLNVLFVPPPGDSRRPEHEGATSASRGLSCSAPHPETYHGGEAHQLVCVFAHFYLSTSVYLTIFAYFSSV